MQQANAALQKAEPELGPAQQAWEKDPVPKGPALRNGLDHHYAFDAAEERAAAKGTGAELQPAAVDERPFDDYL